MRLKLKWREWRLAATAIVLAFCLGSAGLSVIRHELPFWRQLSLALEKPPDTPLPALTETRPSHRLTPPRQTASPATVGNTGAYSRSEKDGPAFRSVAESFCEDRVIVYEGYPYPTKEENERHGNRVVGNLVRFDDNAMVRVIRDEDYATNIEAEWRKTRFTGWVFKGQVLPSCGGSVPRALVVPGEGDFKPVAISVCEPEVTVYTTVPQSSDRHAEILERLEPDPLSSVELKIIRTEGQFTFVQVRGIFDHLGWVKKGQVKPVCHPGHEDEDMGFIPISTSLCRAEVPVLSYPADSSSWSDRRVFALLRPTDKASLKIFGDRDRETEIELTSHGRRVRGWVNKGDVAPSCVGSR